MFRKGEAPRRSTRAGVVRCTRRSRMGLSWWRSSTSRRTSFWCASGARRRRSAAITRGSTWWARRPARSTRTRARSSRAARTRRGRDRRTPPSVRVAGSESPLPEGHLRRHRRPRGPDDRHPNLQQEVLQAIRGARARRPRPVPRRVVPVVGLEKQHAHRAVPQTQREALVAETEEKVERQRMRVAAPEDGDVDCKQQ